MPNPNTLWIPPGSYTNWVEVDGVTPGLHPLTQVVVISYWERTNKVSNLLPKYASTVCWPLTAAYAIVPHEQKTTLHLEYDYDKLLLQEIAGEDQSLKENPEWYARIPNDLKIGLEKVIFHCLDDLYDLGLSEAQIELLCQLHTELQST